MTIFELATYLMMWVMLVFGIYLMLVSVAQCFDSRKKVLDVLFNFFNSCLALVAAWCFAESFDYINFIKGWY